jgi:RNA polymerase sigma-70 factor (ECF subfamily)
MDDAVTAGATDGFFEQAIRTHAGDLFRYAYWLARNRQQAEDIVQEALLRGWRAFPRVRDRAAVKSWLFSIVKNEFHRATAQDARHAGSVDAADLDIVDERASPFAMAMRDALMALPVSYAEPLALQVLGGFSCAEIAAMLQTTEGAVMTRLTRARQALKRLVLPVEAKERKGERS